MASKEHLALKFDICTILQSAKPDETVKTANLILSTILAALQEPTERMLKEAHKAEDESAVHNYGSLPSATDYWDFMLAASALGGASE
ncbi:hypothetical protein [Brucella sp. BO2]|uniref:hypothetical protein n=1 Tax=Brucella sp. BO2 TaxID=693750 RepID=UPI00046CC0DF|nr:hypothetical protein [Brucella sp. BO2]